MHCDVHHLHNHSICFTLELSALQNKNKLLSLLRFTSFKTRIHEHFGGRVFCSALYSDFSTSLFLKELIPHILCTACLHPEPKERDQLLHILFNLIKRPDDEQRWIWLLLWEISIMWTCSFYWFGVMITFLISVPSFLSKVSFNKGNTDLLTVPYSVFLLVLPATYVELLHFCVSYLWIANCSIKSLLLSFIFDFQELLNISLSPPQMN